jgi:hypothetical protein
MTAVPRGIDLRSIILDCPAFALSLISLPIAAAGKRKSRLSRSSFRTGGRQAERMPEQRLDQLLLRLA